MKLLIKIGVQNSCTPISVFLPPTLPVKGYKNPKSKISVDTLGSRNASENGFEEEINDIKSFFTRTSDQQTT